MTLEQYKAIETAYTTMQYMSFAVVNPTVSYAQYLQTNYTSNMADNFRSVWGWVSLLGLESVVEGND